MTIHLDNYEGSLRSTGSTRNLYLSYAKRFLDFASGRELDRKAVEDYLKVLRKQGYSDGTINFTFRVIKRVYDCNGIPWTFRRGEAPQIRESEVFAPALDPEDIGEMITAKDKLTPQERAFLALSTTYGLRRTELASISPSDLDFNTNTVFIMTAHRGRQRYHIIPPEIKPYLEDYNFASMNQFEASTVFLSIEDKAGLQHIDGVGWHAIRRTVDTLLLDKLPEATVADFMRWKSRGIMPQRYYATRFVGRKGGIVLSKESRSVDEKVFEVHPFLPYWR